MVKKRSTWKKIVVMRHNSTHKEGDCKIQKKYWGVFDGGMTKLGVRDMEEFDRLESREEAIDNLGD